MNTYLTILSYSREWTKTKFKEFSSEDIRLDFEKLHPDSQFKNYGSIMRELAKEGKIKEIGSVKSRIPSSKSARILKYISLSYSFKQANNRRLK